MIEPLYNNLFVEPNKEEEKSLGGIILPDQARKKPTEGVVVAVGPGRTLDSGSVEPCPMKVGDRVLFSKYSATEVSVNGKDLYHITADQVYAILIEEQSPAE